MLDTTYPSFKKGNRFSEMARILEDVSRWEYLHTPMDEHVSFFILDANDINIGTVVLNDDSPYSKRAPLPDLTGRVVLYPQGKQFWTREDIPEISRLLKHVAERVRAGDTVFPILDANDNEIGRYDFNPRALLTDWDTIDMFVAHEQNRLFLADGIQKGEYRYVILHDPSYTDLEGKAHEPYVWLVNAAGEKAPGYEVCIQVAPSSFKPLPQAHLDSILKQFEVPFFMSVHEARFNVSGDTTHPASAPPPPIIPAELFREFHEWCEDSDVPEEELNRWDSRFVARQQQFLAERAEAAHEKQSAR
jgi:hypothetical protein